MNTREIRVNIIKEPELYAALYSAMETNSEYDGGYVMQYSESQEDGWRVAVFLLRVVG